jgi:hypothetical protein
MVLVSVFRHKVVMPIAHFSTYLLGNMEKKCATLIYFMFEKIEPASLETLEMCRLPLEELNTLG